MKILDRKPEPETDKPHAVIFEHGEGTALYTPVHTYRLVRVSPDPSQIAANLTELSQQGWETVTVIQVNGEQFSVCRRPMMLPGVRLLEGRPA